MRTIDIMFNDLSPEVQNTVLHAAGVETPEEMNWDVVPVTSVSFCEEVEPEPTPKIKGVTILSEDEYMARQISIPTIGKAFWLANADKGTTDCARYVYGYDLIGRACVDNALGIRPTLILEPDSHWRPGSTFGFNGFEFTVLKGDYAICNEVIGFHQFRRDSEAADANEFEASDLRAFLDAWWKEAA